MLEFTSSATFDSLNAIDGYVGAQEDIVFIFVWKPI